jgi:hypothetical protein
MTRILNGCVQARKDDYIMSGGPDCVLVANLFGQRLIFKQNKGFSVVTALLDAFLLRMPRAFHVPPDGQVSKMIEFAKENKTTLIAFVSAPFGIDARAAHFEVRCAKMQDGVLDDGLLFYRHGGLAATRVPSTMALEKASPWCELTSAVEQWLQHVALSTLDANDGDETGNSVAEEQPDSPSGNSDADKRVRLLQGICTKLRTERAEMQASLKAAEKRLEEALASAKAKSDQQAMESAKRIAKQETSMKAMREEIERLKSELSAASLLADGQIERTTHNTELARQDLKIANTKITKQSKEIVAYRKEIELLNLRLQLAEEASMQSKTECEAFAKRVAQAEESTANATSDLNAAVEQAMKRSDKLQSECTRLKDAAKKSRVRDAQRESTIRDLKKSFRVVKALLALQTARLGTSKAAEGAAVASAVELAQQVREMEDKTSKPVGVDAATITVPTQSKADLELDELRLEVAKLHDVIESMKKKKKASEDKQVDDKGMQTEAAPAPPLLGPRPSAPLQVPPASLPAAILNSNPALKAPTTQASAVSFLHQRILSDTATLARMAARFSKVAEALKQDDSPLTLGTVPRPLSQIPSSPPTTFYPTPAEHLGAWHGNSAR